MGLGSDPQDRWRQVRELFHELVDLDPKAQAGRLADLRAADPGLGAELAALLDAGREAGDRFELGPPMPDDLAATSPDGMRIGPYRVVREIGRGGMGTLYEAVRDDAAFIKRVAVKMVPVGLDTEQVLRRFRQERQILALLEHKNIAALLDGGVTDQGRPYLVMEYVEGERIDRYSSRHGLGVRERLQLMRQVCAAVQYAHQNLVVHRDLKPGNVLVGPDGTVKLLDFGIAKLLEETGTGEELTDTGALPMTTAYASPEQLRGESVTTATDIYSLGVLLYELVSGRPPFRFDYLPVLEARHRILMETPVAPSLARGAQTGLGKDLTRTMSSELDHIVLMAMRKEPERRYRSAEQLAEDLQRFLSGFPVHAQPDSFRYRVGKFVRRNRAAVVALAVTFLALAGGLIVTLWQVGVGRQARDRVQVVNGFLEEVLLASAVNAAGAGQETGRQSVGEALDAAAVRLETPALAIHPEVKAALQQVIGSGYLSLGRNQDSERHLRAALATQERLFGDDHVETLKTRFALARLAIVRAEYAEAEGFFELSLDALRREQRRGNVSPIALASGLSDYALVRRARGDARRAETLFREARALAQGIEGEDARPLLGHVESMLTLTLLDAGKFDEAEAGARRLVAGFRRPGTARAANLCTVLTLLGSTLMEKGALAEARDNLREGEANCRRVFSPDYLPIHDNIRLQAQVNLLDGRLAEAESQIDATLARYRLLASTRYISLATALTVKGLILSRTGREAEAEQVLREAVRLRTEALPSGHFMTALTTGALGEVLAVRGRFAEAESLLVASYQALRSSQAVNNRRTALARQRLVDLYTRWGQPERAASLP